MTAVYSCVRILAEAVAGLPLNLYHYTGNGGKEKAIGMAIACKEYSAKFFANGAAPGGVLEHPGTIKDPQRVRESWQSTFGGSGSSNKIAVLEEGMKYTLDPWVIRWEQSIQRALLTQEEKSAYFVKFNLEGLLHGDYQSRMNGYATARQNGWMSANDILELENLDRIPAEEGGDPDEPKTGRASKAYKEAMLTALRVNFRQVSNVLQEGIDANGGYLVPGEIRMARKAVPPMWGQAGALPALSGEEVLFGRLPYGIMEQPPGSGQPQGHLPLHLRPLRSAL